MLESRRRRVKNNHWPHGIAAPQNPSRHVAPCAGRRQLVPENGARCHGAIQCYLGCMMSLDGTDIAVLAVLFVAVLVRSTFGFGEALVAVPLLAWLIPVELAVPTVCLHSITVAAIVLAQDRHHVHVRSAGRLVLATAVGIPLGLWVLANVDER